MQAGKPCVDQTSGWLLICSNEHNQAINLKNNSFYSVLLEQFKYLYVVNFFMTRVFARTLSRKKIMSNDGKLIGTLKNIRVDFDSGQVIEMLIHPDQTFDTSNYDMEDDKILKISFEAVKDIKDYIVVDRFAARR
jgi:sporulation protein YlmC with PRC-barrel domain